ncbi:kinesin-like protein KIN-13A [Cryptomeria japonica]|uniref:kinesin-like protein KIN-13A n=1 Tax=Cryptomeria japonica TaxID=3369 RepID=UPI0027DA7BE4|nr:kinesin-like protein KIN-13A [Cryptomeria japonica]
MPQSSAAALYDHSASLQSAGNSSDGSSDPVMARWLQSAGLQHLASPVAASTAGNHSSFPGFFSQGYGGQTMDEKQKLYRMLKNMNLGGDPGSEPATPMPQNSTGLSAMDGFLTPELRGEFGAGLLDLHAMDDSELFNEHAGSEPFEASPFVPMVEKGYENDFDMGVTGKQQKAQMETLFTSSSMVERENGGKDGNLAKIKVVVRKRPLNKKEIAKKEEDIVTVNDTSCLSVHEPKLKVDLTAYVEKHDFVFDAILDDHVTNDEVYRVTVEPIVPIIFQRTKATCFAYGQTGNGKTYTMQPLPLRASGDILKLMSQPYYRDQGFQLWLSFFEIYGGKLYDLLSDRRKLCMREDGRQQVCIVGLEEFEVSDVQTVKEHIEKGNGSRSTGSTGANEESSRSHAILQLVIKKQGKITGKLSFIDLAGSERGADTTDNDRQTRMEGAEINKSLLALKECIRALDNDQIHIPFRGSKLTEVLRDSFVGNSRTVMISCISPNTGSCEHTLNTLRYADRVKGLSKSSNSRKDQNAMNVAVPSKDSVSTSTNMSPTLYQGHSREFSDNGGITSAENNRRPVDSLPYYNQVEDLDRHSSNLSSNFLFSNNQEGGFSSNVDKDRVYMKEGVVGSGATRKSINVGQNSFDLNEEDKIQKVSSTRQKVSKEEKPDKQMSWASKGDSKPDVFNAVKKNQQLYKEDHASNNASLRLKECAPTEYDSDINAILKEEEELVAAHRKEIEETMDIVRDEMQLLSDVEMPGSHIDEYVSRLSQVLAIKATSVRNLQRRLARFQKNLKDQDILSLK